MLCVTIFLVDTNVIVKKAISATVKPVFQGSARTQTVLHLIIKNVYHSEATFVSVLRGLTSTIRLFVSTLTSANQNLVIKMRIVQTCQAALVATVILVMKEMEFYARGGKLYLFSLQAPTNSGNRFLSMPKVGTIRVLFYHWAKILKFTTAAL